MIDVYCKHLIEIGYSEETVKSIRYNLIAYKGYIGGNYNKSLKRVLEKELEVYYRY